jgi:proton-coupled amino acid transporter
METYAVVLPLILALTYLPSYKALAYGAYVGTALLIAAVIAIVTYGGMHPHDFVGLTDYDLARLDTFPLFFGVAAFLLCTHGMVIPMEQSLADPRHMSSVILVGGTLVLASNTPFAIFAYLLFGPTIQGYVFCSLPTGTILTIIRVCHGGTRGILIHHGRSLLVFY